MKIFFLYLHGTTDYAICYQGKPGIGKHVDIHGFVDSHWDRDVDCQGLTNGYVLNIRGGGVNWMSRRQSVTALLTTKAEYMVANHASKEFVWI